MRVWLSTIGTSPFAVINTFWAAHKTEGYYPERIYLVKNNEVEKKGYVSTTIEWIKCISKEYGIEPTINLIDAEETDFQNFARKLGDIVKKEKLEGNEIAIDMTPGRKFMSALSMVLGVDKTDRVYYTYLLDNSYQNVPYILIPMTKQKLYDMRKSLLGDKT